MAPFLHYTIPCSSNYRPSISPLSLEGEGWGEGVTFATERYG